MLRQGWSTARLLSATSTLILAVGADYVSETWNADVLGDTVSKNLTGSFADFDVAGAPMSVYLSWPEEFDSSALQGFPAVIVAHHAVGIYHHEFLRQFADDLARQGFVAILPDFFHRAWSDAVPTGLGMPIEKMDIQALLGSLRDDQVLEDLHAVLGQVGEAVPVMLNGKVGVLGFCMGGRIAWLAAVEDSLQGRIHAAVPYHGGNVFKGWGEGTEPPSERVQANLACPVLGHFGMLDQNPSTADMEKLQTLAGDKLQAKQYEGAKHGFSCKDSSNYVESAAQKAWLETVRFLADTLGTGAARSAEL